MVLIADDDRDIVRFVEVNLRLEGFEVITAHDGQDALDKALDLQPNLILLDVMMPRMDGYEVCTKLRADGRSAHIPVIMLTAKSLSADKVLGLTAGADDYIIKPFDPMELVARVKTTLRRASEMRSLSPLTGLPGNLRIEQEIAHRMERGKAVAVAYADLDNFKSYNDRYGFLRGDEVISLFAQVLRQAAQDAAGPEGSSATSAATTSSPWSPRRRPRPSPAGSSAASTTASRPCTTPRTPAPARSSWRTARASSAASRSSRSPWASPPAPSEPSPTTASWSPPPPSSSTWPSAARAPATPWTAAPTGSRGSGGLMGEAVAPGNQAPVGVRCW